MLGVVPNPRLRTPVFSSALLYSLALFAFVLSGTLMTSSAEAACKKCSSKSSCSSGYRCVNGCCKLHLRLSTDVKLSDYRMAIPKTVPLKSTRRNRRLGFRVRRSIRRLLRVLIGTVKVINERKYLERAPHNGIELGTFWFTPWQKVSANGLIKSAVSIDRKKQVTLRLRFYDVDLSRLGFRENHKIPVSKLKSVLKKFCSRVYRFIGGRSVPTNFFSSKIAYVRRGPRGGKDIWVMDVDGTGHRLIVRNGSLNLLPRWTPDGRSLVYTSYIKGNAYLYQVNVRTRKTRRLTYVRGTYTGANPSPDGKRMAFSLTVDKDGSNAEIYFSNINGSNIRRVTRSWGIDASPTWSPDGKKIAFVSTRYASPQIFLMNADGTKQTRLTFKGDYNQEPRWSPTGKEILFTARDERLQYDLFVIQLSKDASGELKLDYRRLTQNQRKNLEADWSPDGKHIIFVSTRFGEKKIFVMNRDGSQQRLLFRGRGDYETPAWSPVPGATRRWKRRSSKATVAPKKPVKKRASTPAPVKARTAIPVQRRTPAPPPVRQPANRQQPRPVGKTPPTRR